MNLDIIQPNLTLVTDVDSVYEAFLSLSRQLASLEVIISTKLNARISLKDSPIDKRRVIEDFTLELVDDVFQSLIERIAELSPASPDQRDHPLREFAHEMMRLPLNLQQKLIDDVLSWKNQFKPEDIKPYLAHALIKNTEWQVFVALASTKYPIWKQ